MNRLNDKLQPYFNQLHHAGLVLTHTTSLHYAQCGGQEQGDWIELMIDVKQNQIQSASFLCFGPAVTIALCEYICSYIEGLTVEQVNHISEQFILSRCSLHQLQRPTVLRVLYLLKKCVNSEGETN